MPKIDIGHQLAIAGYMDDTQAFFDIIAGIWWNSGYAQKYGNVEELLYHCTEAKEFCDTIRTIIGIEIENAVILKTLNNLRKNKFLKTYQEL